MQNTLLIHQLLQGEQIGFESFQPADHLADAGDGKAVLILDGYITLMRGQVRRAQIAAKPDTAGKASQTQHQQQRKTRNRKAPQVHHAYVVTRQRAARRCEKCHERFPRTRSGRLARQAVERPGQFDANALFFLRPDDRLRPSRRDS